MGCDILVLSFGAFLLGEAATVRLDELDLVGDETVAHSGVVVLIGPLLLVDDAVDADTRSLVQAFKGKFRQLVLSLPLRNASGNDAMATPSGVKNSLGSSPRFPVKIIWFIVNPPLFVCFLYGLIVCDSVLM